MNLWILGSLTVIIILLVLVIWKLIVSRKKFLTISDELKFFKKEKEYYDESMMMISWDYNILYANQAAKNLFSLSYEKGIYRIGEKIQLQVKSGTREDFLQALENLNTIHEDSFTLENVYLIVSGEQKKVNIYIDKSVWNIDQTITCIIDKPKVFEVETNDALKDGSIDFLTGLPSQFLALADINSLVIESKRKSSFFGLFLLGIDHFNDIQTTLGLGYTNQILKNLAQYFIENPHENVKIYRMEADKFIFLIDGLDEDELARKMARDIIVGIGNVYRDNNDIRLTSSIGIAIYPRDGENASKLIDNVYIALDKAQSQVHPILKSSLQKNMLSMWMRYR